MTYILLVAGLILLLGGASVLVDSSVSIAKRLGISDFIIGLTIVGMGTSSPELYVSVSSALRGMGDVAIGNVMGSNICNALLILGATALIRPVEIGRSNLRVDILQSVLVALLLTCVCYGTGMLEGTGISGVSRAGGVLLLVCFVLYMWNTVRGAKRGVCCKENEVSEATEEREKGLIDKAPTWVCVLIALGSLALLLWGGDMFLSSSVALARSMGVSEFVISVTIIAVGTSLPELATCVLAAARGNGALALGNVLGSNVFNVLLIIGVSATISPLTASGVNMTDFVMLIASSLLIGVYAFTGKRMLIDRWEGALAVVLYITYIGMLVI